MFTVDVRTGSVRALVQTKEKEEYAEASPDGRRVAFVRGSDLFVVDVAHRQGDAPDPERIRHAAQRQARLGLRGGARLAHRPGVPLVAGLEGDRLPPAGPGARTHASRSWTSCRCATRSSGSATRRRAPRTRSSASASWASTRTAARVRSACSRSTPDDVYVLPQLGWTPDSRGVAFQHMNRAQSELELRLLPVPASPARAARGAAHGPHRALEDLGQHLRRRHASSRTAGASCGSPSATASRTSTSATWRAPAGP